MASSPESSVKIEAAKANGIRFVQLQFTDIIGHVKADAFCHSMVRALVGCLVAVGEGRRPPEWAHQVLTAQQRDSSVVVLHAHGLTLEEVAYPPVAEMATRAEQAAARRESAEAEA